MTFQDALEKARELKGFTLTGDLILAIAEQAETNRVALEQLKHELHNHHHGDVDDQIEKELSYRQVCNDRQPSSIGRAAAL